MQQVLAFHPICFALNYCGVPRPDAQLSVDEQLERFRQYEPAASLKKVRNLATAHLIDPMILDDIDVDAASEFVFDTTP